MNPEICRVFFSFLIAFACLACAAPGHAAGRFSDWAAVVVAGDWHAHDGTPSEIFDNARRDVSADLLTLGFSRANIAQFSARPNAPVDPADARSIGNALWDLTNRTSGGCFVYFSSHGARDGIVLGDAILLPRQLERMLANSCADRPTVVVLSACFSGVFVPTLAAPNRMILTAARADRTSFGCSQTDRYPYFDQCVLSVWGGAADFPGLARAAQACVAKREHDEHVGPPSEPQLWIGAEADLPKWR